MVNSHRDPLARLCFAPFGFCLAAGLLLSSAVSEADTVNGSARFSVSDVDLRRTELTGATEKSESRFFLQHYNLSLDKTIFPNLRLRAGGIFQNEAPVVRVQGVETSNESTQWSPSADLTWSDLLYTAGGGYDRREEREATDGAIPPTTAIRENERALFGWRPDGLPSVEAQFLRTNTYDKRREIQDRVEDLISASSRYRPSDALGLQYRYSVDNQTDAVSGLEISDRLHSGRVTYAERFFGGRFTPSASFSVLREELKTSARGNAEVPVQEFPVSGLSSLDEIPTDGALEANDALIDTDVIASAGLDLGRGRSLGGDRTPRNMGLDFFADTGVNTLYVWVDRELPPAIANSFSWEVYESSDNLIWTLVQVVSAASFDRFDKRFVIRFTKTTSRFIKVTTRPLSFGVPVPPSADVDNIFVTEIQAFMTEGAGGKARTVRTSQVGNANAQVRIFDKPLLIYDVSYWFAASEPTGETRDIFTNGIIARHVLNRVFSVNGRVAVESGRERSGRRIAFLYNASVDAVPLSTLRHSLLYGGRIERFAEDSLSYYSVILKNYAQLYRGVSVNLSGGVSFPRANQRSQTTTFLTAGATLVPHRNLSLNFSYTDQASRGSISETGPSSSFRRGASATSSFRPFETIYLIAGLDRFEESGRQTRTTPRYGLTWSPFADGKIQFTFTHSEEFTPEEEREDTITSPSVRWNLFDSTFLELSYQDIRTKSRFESVDLTIWNADVQSSF